MLVLLGREFVDEYLIVNDAMIMMPSTNTTSHNNGLMNLIVNDTMIPPSTNTRSHNGSAVVIAPLNQNNHSSTDSAVPKILWLYWDQGMDHLKEIGEGRDPKNNKYKTNYACVQAWKILHPAWDVRVLNKTEAKRIAPKYAHLIDESNVPICPVKLSDLLRLEVLTRYGGVYVDTSSCPMRPLDDYIEKLVGDQGFYSPMLGLSGWLERSKLKQFVGCDLIASAKGNPSSNEKHEKHDLASKSRSLSTWFIAARPHHILIRKWMWAFYKLLTDLDKSECANKCHFSALEESICVCRCIAYFVPHCSFTLQRWYDAQVEAEWIKFRRRVRRRHGSKDQDRVCYGGSNPVQEVNSNLNFTLGKCYMVKKQLGDLERFVTSPAYLEAMTKMARPSIPF